jgi:predicted nucleotidyltransferase
VESGSFSDLGIRKLDRLLAHLGLDLVIVGASARATTRRQADRVAPARGVSASSKIGRLLAQRAMTRRKQAEALARSTLARLRALGVEARLVGSLASGRFRLDSDVDYLIENAGRLSEARIVAEIERSMKGFPFDAIFPNRVAPNVRRFILREGRDGSSAVRET